MWLSLHFDFETSYCLRLEELVTTLVRDGRTAFLQAMEETERRIERERQELMESASRAGAAGSGAVGRNKKGSAPWTHDQLQLLIKAVNVFPAGTNQRYVHLLSWTKSIYLLNMLMLMKAQRIQTRRRQSNSEHSRCFGCDNCWLSV